jgi:predicted HAD superfamily Cof-like phosphohydrolase
MSQNKLTHYECVKEFHEQFGHPMPKHMWISVFNENPKLVNLRISLIREEIEELYKGIQTVDIVEILDALSDILYVVHGAGVAFGINLDKYYVCGETIRPSDKRDAGFIRAFDDFIKAQYNVLSFIGSQFENACNSRNMQDVAHTLTLLLSTTYSFGLFFGFDMDKSFRLVHSNNMSKLCSCLADAIATVEDYKTKKGFENVPVDFRIAPDHKHYVMYNKTNGKILKSKDWVEPDFSTVL